MKAIKVSEATNVQLDWLVWKCAGGIDAYPKTGSGKAFLKLWNSNTAKYVHPTTDWSQMGPCIERERIVYSFHDSHPAGPDDVVHARLSRARLKPDGTANWYAPQSGATILIAAARCYVTSKLGDTVEVPEEL